MKSIGNGVWEAPYGLSVPLADAEGITVLDVSGYAETVIVPQNAVRASVVFTDAGVADGETVTIYRIDTSSQVYTWKTALTPTAGEVLIGASNTTALANMLAAITGIGGTPGTTHALGTPPCLDYEGSSDGTTITIQAINYGDAYDAAMATPFGETCASGSWAAATGGVNSSDWLQYHDNSGTAITAADNVEAYPIMRGGEWKFCPVAYQLLAKRFLGVLYDSSAAASGDDSATSVWLRKHLTVITTHHPAAGDPKGVVYAGRLLTPTDLPANGLYIDIPANATHADYTATIAFGGQYGPPETDDIVANMWMEVWSPDTGERDVAEVKSYDFNGGASANEGRATFAVGGGLKFASTLRTRARLFYRFYEANIGRVAELAAQAKTDVNTEVVDALNVDTYAEPVQGAPGATITLAAKINYLYKAFRNRKTQTATVWSLFNDDATTVDHKATVADDGVTASKTEVATGP